MRKFLLICFSMFLLEDCVCWVDSDGMERNSPESYIELTQNHIAKKRKMEPDNKPQTAKKYGIVTNSIHDCPNFVKVVGDILKIDISSEEEAKSLLTNIFCVFKKRRNEVKNIEGKYRSTNILLWDGKLFLNGAMNISHCFDDFSYSTSDRCIHAYPTIQLCDLIDFKVIEMEAIQNIVNIFPKLWKILTTIQPDLDDEIRLSIGSFFNKTKGAKNDQEISKILQEYKKKYAKNKRKFELIELESRYVKSIRILGIDTPVCNSLEGEIRESFEISKDIIRTKINEFLEKFGKYIKLFNNEDGELFLNQVRKLKELNMTISKYLECAEILCLESQFNRYTHTEYMVRYFQKQNNAMKIPLYMISFFDACPNCEEKFAEITSQQEGKFNTIMISGFPYHSSRSDNGLELRKNSSNSVNSSFLQIRLNIDSCPDL
ncbi:MAG: hypothetical protein J6S86_04385 [Alphaproteobacteria bacterium]|nr:hypothetical protein [Alphaproteobacteria bacterium]